MHPDQINMNSNNLPISDHDLLTKLDVKMDSLAMDFKDFRESIILRLIKAESRLDGMDIYHAAIPLKEYDGAYHWVMNLRSNFQLILIVGGALMAVVGGIVANILSKWLHI